MFWGFLALAILFLILMISNSVGNITEIMSMLDDKKLSGEQIQQNYNILVERWGEWTIVGESGGIFSIHFVDIRQAFFSGLMITFLILSIICLVISIVLGKIVFPKLAQYFKDNSQDMANIATLQTAEIIKKNKKEREWF